MASPIRNSLLDLSISSSDGDDLPIEVIDLSAPTSAAGPDSDEPADNVPPHTTGGPAGGTSEERYVEWRGGCWQTKAKAPGERLRWHRLPGAISKSEGARASRVAAVYARRLASGEAAPAIRGTTPREYLRLWTPFRLKFGGPKGDGVRSQPSKEGHIRNHFLPVWGDRPMVGFTLDDACDVKASLEKLAKSGKLGGSSPATVYSSIRTMFEDAAKCTHREMRVQGMLGNPFAALKAPVRPEPADLQFLYPNEFLKLVACGTVPLRRRRLYALAVYLYSRKGEVAALEWEVDIDIEHWVAHVTRSYDDSTKTGGTKRLSIKATLRPLLLAMHKESAGKGKLLSMTQSMLRAASRHLRADLKRAGVNRPELHHNGIGTRRLRQHDLRATAATWLAVEGATPYQIAELLGDSIEVAMRYVRLAGQVKEDFGTPFPPLPACLLKAPEPDSAVFVEYLRDLLASERVRLAEPDEPVLERDDGPTTIGWRSSKSDHVHLLPVPAYREVARAMGQAGYLVLAGPGGRGGGGRREMWLRLIADGFATPGPTSDPYRVQRSHAGSVRWVVELLPHALAGGANGAPPAGTMEASDALPNICPSAQEPPFSSGNSLRSSGGAPDHTDRPLTVKVLETTRQSVDQAANGGGSLGHGAPEADAFDAARAMIRAAGAGQWGVAQAVASAMADLRQRRLDDLIGDVVRAGGWGHDSRSAVALPGD